MSKATSGGDLVSVLTKEKKIRIVPDTSLDSLIAASILLKTLREHNKSPRVSLDPKLLLDDRDEPSILLNLPPVSGSRQVSLVFTGESSITGIIASLLDDLFVIEWWDKVLAIIAGLYRNLYVFREGKFKGVEDRILRELISSKKLVEVPSMLRAWGVDRLGLARSLKRTLIPFMPGLTGNIEPIKEITQRIFKRNPEELRVLDASNEKEMILLLEFLRELARVLNVNVGELSNKLLGDFIVSSEVFEGLKLQLSEAMGALLVFNSLEKRNPLYVIGVSVDSSLIPSMLTVYEEHIEEASSLLGITIPKWLADRSEYIDVEEFFERPGIVADILGNLNALPQGRPVLILHEGVKVTELRELLRIGVKPEDAYARCDEVQLCVVK
ncbi:MAG: phosphoesterase [Desulfurococcus sp.]|nr:phosphoesterase [Desulfurococcus sp.]